MRSNHKTSRSRTQSIRRAAIDALEPRRMLATIVGTSGNDTITIFVTGSTTHVVVNGTDNTTSDLTISVLAGAGDDFISVSSTRSGSNITVDAGGDNDFLQNAISDLDGVFLGNFTYNGSSGIDALAADNGTDSMSNGTIDI